MTEIRSVRPPGRIAVRDQAGLGWAFVERQTNLWKRHWAWEVVWLLYGVVNTLAVTFIGKQLGQEGVVGRDDARRLVLFLLIGTLVWAYSVETLPGLLRVASWFSPATYLLRSVRAALMDGRGVADARGDLAAMAVFAAVLIPLSVAVFSAAERWAKRTGRLKRHG